MAADSAPLATAAATAPATAPGAIVVVLGGFLVVITFGVVGVALRLHLGLAGLRGGQRRGLDLGLDLVAKVVRGVGLGVGLEVVAAAKLAQLGR